MRGDPDRSQRAALGEDVLGVEHLALGCRDAAREATICAREIRHPSDFANSGDAGTSKPVRESRLRTNRAPTGRESRSCALPSESGPCSRERARVQVPRRFPGNLTFGQNNGFMRFEIVFRFWTFGFGGDFALFADCLKCIETHPKKVNTGVSRKNRSCLPSARAVVATRRGPNRGTYGEIRAHRTFALECGRGRLKRESTRSHRRERV